MIVLKKIFKSINNKQVLKNIDLSLPPGQIVALCGPNGSGKTTLIRIILDIIQPDSGQVNLSVPLRSISFMLHNNCLFDDLSLEENIKFFLKIKNVKNDSKYFEKYLNLLSLQNDRSNRISTFSKGMSQKADLLRTLMEKPEVLLLDEPTSHLDPIGKIEIRKLLKNLTKEEGISIFLTSHLLHEVEKIADKVVILSDGEIKWRGDVEVLLKNGKDLETTFLEVVSGQGENY